MKTKRKPDRISSTASAASKTDAKSRPIVRPPLQEAHADVALATIGDLEALTRMKRSWIYQAIEDQRFPAAVIREPRCTRWKISDVRLWLIDRAAQPQAGAAALVHRAKAASAAAKSKHAPATAAA